MITKLTIKLYLQIISLKNYSVKTLIIIPFDKKKNTISFEKIHSIKNMYTCFFANRATKTCQSRALIGTLMALVT